LLKVDIVGKAEKLKSLLISYAYKAMIKKSVKLLLLQFKMTIFYLNIF